MDRSKCRNRFCLRLQSSARCSLNLSPAPILASLAPMPDPQTDTAQDHRPLVISLCGTYLKPEMLSIHRQITGLKRVRTKVYAQWLENEAQFPFHDITLMTKQHHRPRGNFLLRFWYKHVIKKWPPPREIGKYIGPCHPWNLADLLERDQPALVHVYYGHKAVAALPMLVEWGGPWIVSFHGVDVAKNLDEKNYAKKLAHVFERASLVLARSESLAHRLADLGCPQEKLRLNRTPVPMDDLPALTRTAPEDGHWRLLQACRLIPKKGILTMLEAIDRVGAIFPGVKYVLCGDGPMMAEIKGHVALRSLERHVEIRGWLSQDELRREFYRSHIFVHPSETTEDGDQEGIPNSMLEAMATGMPVIATHHGGIPEAVTDGHDGLLVAEKDSHALSTAITKMLHDHALHQTLSANAAASVRAHFESHHSISALEHAYMEAIGIHEMITEAAA